jgi:hypothetical protein
MGIFDIFRRKPPTGDPASSALRLSLSARTSDDREPRSATLTLTEGFDLRESEGKRTVCDYRGRRLVSVHPADGALADLGRAGSAAPIGASRVLRTPSGR